MNWLKYNFTLDTRDLDDEIIVQISSKRFRGMFNALDYKAKVKVLMSLSFKLTLECGTIKELKRYINFYVVANNFIRHAFSIDVEEPNETIDLKENLLYINKINAYHMADLLKQLPLVFSPLAGQMFKQYFELQFDHDRACKRVYLIVPAFLQEKYRVNIDDSTRKIRNTSQMRVNQIVP